MNFLHYPSCQWLFVRLSSHSFHSIYCNLDRILNTKCMLFATCYWRKNRNNILKFWGKNEGKMKKKDSFRVVFLRGNWLDFVQPELFLNTVKYSYLCCEALFDSIVTIFSRRSWLYMHWKPKKNRICMFPIFSCIFSHIRCRFHLVLFLTGVTWR